MGKKTGLTPDKSSLVHTTEVFPVSKVTTLVLAKITGRMSPGEMALMNRKQT